MKLATLVLCAFTALSLSAQQQKRDVIFDNDFAGDADGLYALAQMMQSTAVNVKAIVGSHLHEDENWARKGEPSATVAVSEVERLQEVMGAQWSSPVLQGSNTALTDTLTPILSDGARAIVDEAMRHDSEHPLYVLCGGGLTEIASAWLINRQIESRIILVWIGGEEYPGTIPTPRSDAEYNTTIDIKAAQVIFNHSRISLWQVPRDAYRQCLISYAMLCTRFKGSAVGDYLLAKLGNYIGPDRRAEAYVLGDSPLVLLSALQSNWEPDACSSVYEWRARPRVNDQGRYDFESGDGKVRVYRRLDTYLMFEDMFAKLGDNGL